MSNFCFGRQALSGCSAALLLAGCGGLQPPTDAHVPNGATPFVKHDQHFTYTGGKQWFKVPADVTQLKVMADGANGANGTLQFSGYASTGGFGGTVTATIPVTPGERLAIFVGGGGAHGGFNGGGFDPSTHSPCTYDCFGYGGGASDVRQGGARLADRIVVAGGGGGGAGNGYAPYSTFTNEFNGGNGGSGGREGGSGADGSYQLAGAGGAGGTQTDGGKGGEGGAVYGSGSGGCNGSKGARVGGAGGSGCDTGQGGAGGGGYYGGGGGGAGGSDFNSRGNGPSGAGGGGGGGSSFAEKSATHVTMRNGDNPSNHGDGSIRIIW